MVEDNLGASEATKNPQTKLASSTSGKPRDTPGTKSTGNQQSPANSTLPAVLGLPVQCNLCKKEIPSKGFFQHCQTDHNIDVLGLPMQCNICEREISSKYFYQHCQANHNIRKPSINQHVIRISPKPDSIYRNYGKLKPGVVMVTVEIT